MPLRIDLKSAIFALSDALDLVGVNDYQHGKRVAMIARETAQPLGLSSAQLDNLVLACLMHDLGVSSTAEHQRLILDAGCDDRQAHCQRAWHLLQPFAHLSRLADAIRWHHTPWRDLPETLSDTDRGAANLILLADRVDALLLRHGLDNPLFHRAAIRDEIAGLSGTLLHPEIVRAFLAVSGREAFWLALAPHHVRSWLNDQALPDGRLPSISPSSATWRVSSPALSMPRVTSPPHTRSASPSFRGNSGSAWDSARRRWPKWRSPA
jgi:hypothetical protein